MTGPNAETYERCLASVRTTLRMELGLAHSDAPKIGIRGDLVGGAGGRGFEPGVLTILRLGMVASFERI
jgi:hypothetical protein